VTFHSQGKAKNQIFTAKYHKRNFPMNHPTIKKTALSVAIAASVFLTATAHAQLEEVIVTAQKRAQSLQDVPMAVSALSADTMNNAGVQTMQDVAKLVPSLEIQSNTGPVQSNFRLRRVGNLGNIPTFESAVGVFVDGAFRSRSIFGVTELFDIERIEILRGPQSTLYGKNVTGGVIGIYTAAPAEEFEWRSELTVGSMENSKDAPLGRFKGGVSGPLTDSLGGSLGVSYSYRDHTQEQAVAGAEDANDEDRYSVRGQLQWDASEALTIRTILGTMQQSENDQSSNDYYYDPEGYVATFVLPTLQAAGVSQVCTDNDPHNDKACNRLAITSDVEAYEATLLANYEFDSGLTLDSITSWDTSKFKGQQNDVAQVMAPILRYHDTWEDEAFQQEFRLTSSGDSVDWMTGVFYYTNTFNRGDNGDRAIFLYDTLSDDPTVAAVNGIVLGTPFDVPMATQGQLGFLDSEQETDYLGIYGQGTWRITEAFNVTAGLRWQEEEKDAYVRQWVNDPSISVISAVLSPTLSGEMDRKADDVTWSVTPQWFVTDDTMVFATVSHGFKSGGFNTGFGELPIDGREFDDEDIMHYETGIKSDLLDGTLRLAASVFYTEYDDYQDAAFIGAQFTVGNAETVELKGFEVEGTWLAADKLTLDFAVSYADLSYDKNTSGMCYPGRLSDSATTPGACDLSGEHPINAPEWKTHLGALYEQPVSWGDVYARVDWSWTDEYNTSFSADPRLTQDSYSLVGVRVGSRWDNFELVGWVDNLTDEEVSMIDAVANIYAGDNSVQSYLESRRSYGLTLRVNY
jgi:outer membrane receptor protein involved in Fe transport